MLQSYDVSKATNPEVNARGEADAEHSTYLAVHYFLGTTIDRLTHPSSFQLCRLFS